MSKMMRLLFERWLEENHPYYLIISGLIELLLYIAFLASIIFIWVYPWWWKMTISELIEEYKRNGNI